MSTHAARGTASSSSERRADEQWRTSRGPPHTPSPPDHRRSAPTITPLATVAGHYVVPGIGVKPDPKELKRARRSEIERHSRERRQGTVSSMRQELERLEAQYKLLTSLDASSTRGAIARPEEVTELRTRFLQLSKEATALRVRHKTLRAMLHEKQLYQDSIRSHLSSFSDDGIFSWNAVAHAQYEPLDPDDCFNLMRDAYDTIARFERERDVISSGLSVLGWSDKRRLDESIAEMQFSFTKKFDWADPGRLMAESWEMFRDEHAMRKTIFGPGIHVNLETLQVVSDDILIMRRHTRYLAMQKSFHTVYLLFRVRTDRGYTLCFRTIPCPSIQHSIEEGESWIEIFHWLHIKHVGSVVGRGPEHSGPVEVVFGGSIGGSVIKFAMHWMIELIMTVMRWENACVAPLFITEGMNA